MTQQPPPVTPPLHIDALTVEDGLDIAMWRAPGPWAVEDSLVAPRPDDGFWAVRDTTGFLVGYCCFGERARPVGLPAEPGTLDVALGLDPRLSGTGLTRVFARAVVDHGREVADERRLRCAVASWNGVGRHTAEAVGFREVGRHEVTGGRSVTTYRVYET